jgi:hypothetical protein
LAISEERWLAAWHLLSLNRARPFFKDLWIRLDGEDQFVAELRTFIEFALKTKEYHRQPGALHHRIAAWFTGKYGHAGFASISSWVLHIFVHGGADRMPEKVWSSLLQHIPADGSLSPDWVLERMNGVRDLLNTRDDDFASRMEVRESPVSSWDRQALPVYSSSPEATDRVIALICSYNNLLLSWSQTCSELNFDQLRDVYDRGLVIAKQVGWRAHEVPFPGNWEFDLGDLIHAARAEAVIPRALL